MSLVPLTLFLIPPKINYISKSLRVHSYISTIIKVQVLSPDKTLISGNFLKRNEELPSELITKLIKCQASV